MLFKIRRGSICYFLPGYDTESDQTPSLCRRVAGPSRPARSARAAVRYRTLADRASLSLAPRHAQCTSFSSICYTSLPKQGHTVATPCSVWRCRKARRLAQPSPRTERGGAGLAALWSTGRRALAEPCGLSRGAGQGLAEQGLAPSGATGPCGVLYNAASEEPAAL